MTSVPQTMKALVKYDRAAGHTEIREIPVPVPKADEVLVRVKACGVDRGADLWVWKSVPGMWFALPVVIGAENCGEVAAIGSAVKDWSVGDRVVSEVVIGPAGGGKGSIDDDYLFAPDKLDLGRKTNGAFAQYFVVRERYLHRIPDNVSWRAAVLSEMAAVAARSVLEVIGVPKGAPVAIIGPGPVGLIAAQLARIGGASEVVLFGLAQDEGRFAIARELGVTNCVVTDVPASIEEMEKRFPSGFPLVIEASGGVSGAALALKLAAIKGTIAALGTPLGKQLPVDWVLIALKQLTIQGTYGHIWSTWELILSLAESGELKLEPLYSTQYPLEDWETAFIQTDTNPALLKVAVCPNGPI